MGWDDNGAALTGLSAVSSLRSLALIGELHPEALDLVRQVTQVTSLELMAWQGLRDTYSSMSQVVRQLTGLQRLGVDQGWLVECGQELSSLQQLTQLVVYQYQDLEYGDPSREAFLATQELMEPIPTSLTALQHVVYIANPPDTLAWGRRVLVVPTQEEPLTCRPRVQVSTVSPNTELPLEFGVLRPRHLRPCPHLPGTGVWEVVPQPQEG
jgi:hypothetical protein